MKNVVGTTSVINRSMTWKRDDWLITGLESQRCQLQASSGFGESRYKMFLPQ